MAALTLGSFLGGRWALGEVTLSRLAGILAVSGVYGLALPTLADVVFPMFRDRRPDLYAPICGVTEDIPRVT